MYNKHTYVYKFHLWYSYYSTMLCTDCVGEVYKSPHVSTYLILKVPDSVSVCELFVQHPTLGSNTTLKPTHVEEKVRIVLAVD